MTHAIAEPGATTSVSLREFHPFEAAGTRYVYMVPADGTM